MSMAASSHQSGEVAASVAAVTDVLDHLNVTTHQVHSAIARRGLVGMLPTPVRSSQDAVTAAVYDTVRAGIALAGRTATLALESVERTRTAQPWTINRGVANSPGYSTARSATGWPIATHRWRAGCASASTAQTSSPTRRSLRGTTQPPRHR
jgi:hypothetical protein